MKPYYQEGGITIYCKDCQDMSEVETMSADLVLTDPPYMVGRWSGNRDDYEYFCKQWFNEASKKSPCLVFTPGQANMDIYYRMKKPVWVICWRVGNSQSHSPIGGFVGWEPVLVYGKPPKAATRDFWDAPLLLYTSAVGKHDYPKPEKLIISLIADLTNPDDVVLDPFLGSGTTAWCAKKLGRKCIGYEIREDYCEIAANRCRQTVMDLSA